MIALAPGNPAWEMRLLEAEMATDVIVFRAGEKNLALSQCCGIFHFASVMGGGNIVIRFGAQPHSAGWRVVFNGVRGGGIHTAEAGVVGN